MSFPRASGVPDYGPTGTINYDPVVYSGKLVEKFYKTTVFGEIASTDYEGDITGLGANVIIRTVPDVTVSDYVIGNGLTNEYPQRNSVTLSIDNGKSFAVAVSTVDARQSDLDMADIFAVQSRVAEQIAERMPSKIGKKAVKDAVKRLGLASGSPVSTRAKKLGLAPRRFKGMHSARNAKILAMYDDGWSIGQIAAKFGLAEKTVYDLINYGDTEPEKARVKVSAASLNAMIAKAQAAKDARR